MDTRISGGSNQVFAESRFVTRLIFRMAVGHGFSGSRRRSNRIGCRMSRKAQSRHSEMPVADSAVPAIYFLCDQIHFPFQAMAEQCSKKRAVAVRLHQTLLDYSSARAEDCDEAISSGLRRSLAATEENIAVRCCTTPSKLDSWPGLMPGSRSRNSHSKLPVESVIPAHAPPPLPAIAKPPEAIAAIAVGAAAAKICCRSTMMVPLVADFRSQADIEAMTMHSAAIIDRRDKRRTEIPA
jgi:hypothetical protein